MLNKISKIGFIFDKSVFTVENKEESLLEIFLCFKDGLEFTFVDKDILRSKEISILLEDLIVTNNILGSLDPNEEGPIRVELEFTGDKDGFDLDYEDFFGDLDLPDEEKDNNNNDKDNDQDFGFSGDWWKE